MKKLFLLLMSSWLVAAVACSTNDDGVDPENPEDPEVGDTTTTGPEPEAVELSALSVNGNQLVNEAGEPVVLHGVSFGWHNWWGQFWDSRTVKTLAQDWDAEIVRAAMGVEADGGYLDDAATALTKVNTVVEAAVANDIYVIIDWHCHGIQLEAAKEFFGDMATKYKGVKNVIYEIWNEPHSDDSEYTWAEIKAYSEEVIGVIRAIEPDALILVGTPKWSTLGDDVIADPLVGYENIMYVFHFYAASHTQDRRDSAQESVDAGLPIFVSECGSMYSSGDGDINETEWNAWVEWMDERSISWVAWSISAKDETCSMITTDGNYYGSWTDDMIKPWGKMVKDFLNAKAGN
ncbi:MAG: glycoside hydrolase family 5 protein [Rikenellaceae bacterium]